MTEAAASHETVLDEDARLRAARLNVLVAQIKTARFTTLGAIAMFGGIFIPTVGWVVYATWAVAMLAAYGARDAIVKRTVESGLVTKRAEDRVVWSSAMLSFVINIPGAFFLPAMTPEMASIYITLSVGWLTVAVLIIGIHPLSYMLYVGIGFTMIAIGWTQLLSPLGTAVAIAAMILASFILAGFSRRSAAVYNESFQIRSQRDDLLRQRSRFLAQTAHDLLQPITAMRLWTDVALHDRTAEARQEAVSNIAVSAETVESMFRGLLDQSRIDEGGVQPQLTNVRLAPVVQGIGVSYSKRCELKGLATSFNAPMDLYVRADATLLDRVLRNLVDNAFKFTEQGSIALEVREQGDHVMIAVVDTGVGIRASELAEVTNAFYRATNQANSGIQGIGLGLSVASQFTERMGGTFEITSSPGEGTRATVSLPKASAADEATTARETSLTRRRLLIVDDDVGILRALSAQLTHEDVEHQVFSDIDDALDWMEDPRFEPEHFVVDYELGGEMNGLEAIAALQKMHDVPATLVTAANLSRDDLPAHVGLRRKPFDLDDLWATIEGTRR